VALTFTGAPAACTVHLLATAGSDLPLMLLDADEVRAETCAPKVSGPPRAAHLAEMIGRLHGLGNGARQSRWPVEPAPTVPGVLIAEPCTLTATQPELSALGLLAEVISPLWRYQHARELTYDDF
jgi:hypothetical protein